MFSCPLNKRPRSLRRHRHELRRLNLLRRLKATCSPFWSSCCPQPPVYTLHARLRDGPLLQVGAFVQDWWALVLGKSVAALKAVPRAAALLPSLPKPVPNLLVCLLAQTGLVVRPGLVLDGDEQSQVLENIIEELIQRLGVELALPSDPLTQRATRENDDW